MPPILDNLGVWALVQGRALMWLLVITRLTGLMTALPIGQDRVPVQLRVIITLLTATIIAPLIPLPPEQPTSVWGLVGVMATELACGILLGLVISWILEAVSFAGQLMDIQMGFSFVQFLDPTTSRTTSISGAILTQVAFLFLFVTGLQHQMIMALVESYRIVPIGSGLPGNPEKIIILMGMIMVKGLQLAFPVLLVLFFIDVLEGISAKFMPQLQLMQLSFPIKISVGLMTLHTLLNEFPPWLYPLFNEAPTQALKLLR